MDWFSARRKIRRLAGLALLILLIVAAAISAEEGRRLRSGYASLSCNMTTFWVANEGGYFKKYGLDVDQVGFPSVLEGIAATTAIYPPSSLPRPSFFKSPPSFATQNGV